VTKENPLGDGLGVKHGRGAKPVIDARHHLAELQKAISGGANKNPGRW